jgi:hypothetical protein
MKIMYFLNWGIIGIQVAIFFLQKTFFLIQMQDNVIYVNPYILTLIRDLKANSSNDNP